MSFGMSFAGIPFCLDQARKVGVPDGIGNRESIDMVAEIDRLFPFNYLQDLVPSQNSQGRTSNSLAIRRGDPYPDVRIGEWFYPTTASHWSIFRGLATKSQASKMMEVTAGIRSATFIMEATGRVQTEMFMLPPRPLAEYGASTGSGEELYLVTLVDERYYWQFASISLQIDQKTTWESLIGNLAKYLQIYIIYFPIPSAYTAPEPDSQLWASFENAAELFDAIAYNLGLVVVRHTNEIYSLQTSAESQAVTIANVTSLPNGVAGGEIFSLGLTGPTPGVVSGPPSATGPDGPIDNSEIPISNSDEFSISESPILNPDGSFIISHTPVASP